MADPGAGSFTPINIFAMIRALVNNGCPIVTNAGAPSNGTSGTFNGQAGPGAILIDYTNSVLYVNTNTLASPTWTAFVSLTGTQTLTNKTLTAAILNSPTLSAAIFSDYKVLVASAAYTTNATPATLTGFSWSVVPGTYIFEVNLPATMTTNGGLTVEFALTTAVLTSIQYQTYAATATDNTTAVSTQGTTTTSATKVFDSKTAAYILVTIKGSMVVGTGGTFALQACQNTSHADTTTVLLGSYAKLERVL